MQQLHLVGLTTDHTGLILSARRGAKTGKYSVAADEKLLAAVQEAQRLMSGGDAAEVADTADTGDDDAALPTSTSAPAVALPPPLPAKPVSSLSPREIQSRLRAGGTVSEIAAAAGVNDEWILRFADPIRAEQARVVERAQRLTFNKPRLGHSAEPLETSVLLNLAERGVRLPADIFATAWTAFNLHGTSWAVVFSYTSRQRRQSAQWEVDLRSGDLIARNRLASDLGYLEPGRRRRRMEPLEVPGEEETDLPVRRPQSRATTTTGTRAAVKRAAAPKKVIQRGPAAKKGPAKKSAMNRSAAGTRATATTTGPGVTKASAARKAPARRSPNTATATAAKRTSTSRSAAAAKRATTTRKAPAAKKGGGRQSTTPGRRPAKKPAKTPAPQETGPGPAVAPPAAPPPVLSDRPTHLARPPSPMNLSNRAVTMPGRLVGAPSLRPHLPPTPRLQRQAPPSPPPAPSPRRSPRHDAAEAIGFAPEREEAGASANGAGPEDATASPRRRGQSAAARGHDAGDAGDARGSAQARGATGDFRGSPGDGDDDRPTGGDSGAAEGGGDSGRRVRRRRSERRITARDEEDKPSVVILSTPAVRRLEPSEEPRRRAPAPPP